MVSKMWQWSDLGFTVRVPTRATWGYEEEIRGACASSSMWGTHQGNVTIHIKGPADSSLVMTAFPVPVKKQIYIACNKVRRYELMPAVLALPQYTNAHQYF